MAEPPEWYTNILGLYEESVLAYMGGRTLSQPCKAELKLSNLIWMVSLDV